MAKAIQSLWFQNSDMKTDYSCGWLSTKYNLFSLTLSCIQLAKLFDKVELFTDDIGTELIVEKLQLPYTSVRDDLNIIKESKYPWVMNKIYTYSLQSEPFLHIDTDAYLFEHPINIKLTEPLIAQNFEFNHPCYINALKEVENFEYLPHYIQPINKDDISAVNAGIIGGTNFLFYKVFYNEIINFININEKHWINKIPKNFNVFLEQYLFKKIADRDNIPISYLIKDQIGYPFNYKLDRFIDLPNNCSYIHVMNYKNNLTICEQMAQRLWIESPHMYERVEKISKQIESSRFYIENKHVKIVDVFYRTKLILYLFPELEFSNQLSSVELFIQFLNSIPETKNKRIVVDVFSYELAKQEFINKFNNTGHLINIWKKSSISVNSLLKDSFDNNKTKSIKLSKYCIRHESEWNWNEFSEFANQAPTRKYSDNLKLDPYYYETLFFISLSNGITREYFLDTLAILILDEIETTNNFLSLIDEVCNSIINFQHDIDQTLLKQSIADRIRFFLFQGIFEVAE